MPKPRRVLRFVLPAAAALLLFAALDAAQASIRRELDEMMAHVESGDVDADRVHLSKRQVRYTVTIDVTSAKERKQVRYARLRLLLDGDRLAVYRLEGWPTHRRYESYAGSLTELWLYDDKDVTYVFQDGRLIDTRIR